ncbi:MAG: TerB family tellurite resistance protein [Alphaproteobacteria bacterium]|nr:TerB family tellurite resistance protein [Alphaproteobacteria bacterium]MBP7759374.1 TerB family tellurite resistance protein [Alphaproteobacteria bacterium]MBP7762651.1 TerB family tellurite resistance protein [Alphaproteobacteria bacterium]MBP7906055.1 TerB family tellurite resistance protein [Alphaproteobacteria bacterium]
MKNEDEEGLVLEYLKDLIFYDEGFVYGEDCDYSYEDIFSIKYSATAIKNSVASTTYETYLCLHMSDGFQIKIDQERSFFWMNEKKKAEAVMRASAIFHEVTFTNRMERYEKQLKTKSFVSWGQYQFAVKGEFFKNYELLFNLRDKDVKKSLDVFSFQVSKKSKSLKESFFNFWKGHEAIDISIDRDCFLYFMKNYLGLTWKDEVVKEKKKPRRSEFFQAVIILGAKVCKADGRVDVVEIKTFKTYFGIDEKSFPGSEDIFRRAATSVEGIQEPAQKI